MIIQLDYNDKELMRASGNYLIDMECFEVEIIKNDSSANTKYRIEFIDNDYIDIGMRELRILRRLLNNDIVVKKLKLESEV